MGGHLDGHETTALWRLELKREGSKFLIIELVLTRALEFRSQSSHETKKTQLRSS